MEIEQKEKELDGKRYKLISESIKKRRDNGEDIPYELEIDLHYCWMLTINEMKNSLKANK